MSMILDALKRSREDGDVFNAVPSIDTSHEFTAKKVVPSIGFQGLAISIGFFTKRQDFTENIIFALPHF